MEPVKINMNNTAEPRIKRKSASGQWRILKRIPIVAMLQAILPNRTRAVALDVPFKFKDV